MEMDSSRVVRGMKLALKAAEQALQEKEVPVGCVIVRNDRVIAAGSHPGLPSLELRRKSALGWNRTNATRNATRHAEMEALDSLSASTEELDLSECTLFVTCEPCIMCASALSLAKMGKGTERVRVYN